MKRTFSWSIWLSSGLLILLLLGGIVTIMVKFSNSTLAIEPRFDAVDTIPSTSQWPIVDKDVQEKIKIVYGRKGYSNPTEDDDDASDVVVRKSKRTKRPLRIIGKDFDPCQSYTIRHPNGTLSYVFPCPEISSTPTSTTNYFGGDNNPATVVYREGSSDVPITNETECTPETPICSNVADYPHELINQIMDRQKDRYAEVFGNDVVVSNGDKLAPRNMDEEGNPYENICESEEKVHYPRSGFNVDTKSVIIVNTDVYKQGVRVETCRNKHKPCDRLMPMFTKTECKQFFHYRTLLAIHPKTHETYKEKILLPSCCKCVILR